MEKKNVVALVAAIGVCEAVGIFGSLFTASSVGTWYAALTKPALNPPAWVFGPVWTALYALMGIAAFLVWKKARETREGGAALRVFAFQLALNGLWSVLFFGLHLPAFALVDIVLLWLVILWTIVRFSRISRAAAWLLAPYLAWVTFATYLNLSLLLLN